MTRRLTVAERHASATKDLLLEEIADQSSWDQFLVEQAVLAVGRKGEFSANDFRHLLPEMGRGFLGAAISALHGGGLIRHTGRYVPSDLASTNGHRLSVWELTDRALAIAADRATARRAAAA
ncbi:hypothetical protein ACFWNR_06185 [Streptomyces virginiae]|uniref:hypothetical protein n=1 Tax=Streptomyces virginiae TaxID=1961 RepID=UPI0036690F93